MHQLVYISTSRSQVSTSLLEAILLDSRVRNASSDVTGLLVSGGMRFLQALEGPANMVCETLAYPQRPAAFRLRRPHLEEHLVAIVRRLVDGVASRP